MKKGLLFFVLFLLIVSTASALEMRHEVIQGEALPGAPVTYNINFNNNEDRTLTIILSTADLNWVLEGERKFLSLDPNEAESVEVTFAPLAEDRILPGYYGVTLFADTETTRLERILPAKILDYTEVLNVEFSPAAQIDPRRGAILRLQVINGDMVVLDNLNLRILSDHFDLTKTFSLGKRESTILEFPVTLAPNTITGEYSANIVITSGSNTFVDTGLPYVIQEYENLQEVITPESGFLTSGENILQSNEGNSPISNTVSRQFSWLAYKFTEFNPEPSRMTQNDDGYLVEWDVNVFPQKEIQISYKTNYRLLGIIIIIIIIALALWYTFRKRNAIAITKRVLAMHTGTGSVRVMKIVLNVRNRGAISINNLRVIDKVPSMIKAPTKYGTMKPVHVKASPVGTTMVWDFVAIRPREEKIISYVLEGKIQVLGRLGLPPAMAKYILFGRQVIARSGSTSLKEKK